MRLRVEVLRHGLPPAKVLWNAEPEQTVSQLLEQIDDTFPLEADGWGFEDYALQVAGYEVLHYTQLGQLLKDDDEVTIKPLQSNDIRARRVSGRMQITADGRHLVDGVAFGRPLLRRPARPDLYIPPRKRIRLAEPEEEDDDEDDEDDGEDDSDSDEAYEDHDQSEYANQLGRLGDHVVEPRDEEDEDEEDDEEYGDDTERDEDGNNEPLAIEGPAVDQVPDMLEKFEGDDALTKVLLGALRRSEPRSKQQKRKRISNEAGDQDTNSPVDFLKLLAAAMSKPRPTISKKKKGKHVTFQGDTMNVPDVDDSEEEENDQDFEPSSDDDDEEMDETDGDVGPGTDASDSSWDGITSGAATPAPATDSTRVENAATLLSDSDDASSSDGTSDPDSDDSNSESESEDSSSDSDSDESSAPSEEGIKPKQQHSIPFQGMAATKRRNARRRDVRKLKYLQSQGILPGTATRADLIEWEKKNGGRRGSDEDPSYASHAKPSKSSEPQGVAADESDASSSSLSEEEDLSLPELKPQRKKAPTKQQKVNTDFTSDFQKKREALLAALADGGVDVQSFSAGSERQSEAFPNEVNMVDGTNESTPAESDAEPSRRKLDVAASQRLLFGSLGVRRPRDDADREKLRAKLAAQGQRKPVIQPSVAAQKLEQQQDASVEEEEDNQDPNLWKKKINLTAVECVTEDVEYTRPTFPFRQRWDPQMREKKRKRVSQAYTAKKGRKTQHDYQDYYAAEGGDALNYDDEAGGAGYAEDSYWDDNEGYYDENSEYHYYAEEGAEEGAADETQAAENQLLQESTTSSNTLHTDNESDLPPVPTDLSALPLLTLDNALPGAIITFTRFEVSAATNWAPATPPVRVGQISAVHDDEGGKVLELQLAKRDMPRKEYDHQGKRVFSGFEMDLGDEEQEGILEVTFAELLEGRIVKAAPDSAIEAAAEQPEVQDAGVEDKGDVPETNKNEEDSPAVAVVEDVVEVVEA